MNICIITGNLGRDPELRYTTSGKQVCNISVATNRKWTNRETGEVHEEVVWFRVSVWGKQAEACNQYLSKGRKVCVKGRMQPAHAWIAESGEARANNEMTAEPVEFLGGGNGNGGSEDNNPPDIEDRIPF